MWPFRKAKNELTWQLSQVKDKDGGFVGTHLLAKGAERDRREFPYVVFLTLPYSGRPLPTSEEMQAFRDFDERLDDFLARFEGTNVGVFTHGGKRDYICYAADGQAVASLAYAEFASYSPQIEVKHDPGWSEYRGFADMA